MARSRPANATTGLTLLLTADAITGTADGAPVTSWPDSSSNAAHAVQATTANQPTYSATGCNGRPAVTFSGTQYLDSPATNGARPLTVVMLLKVADVQSTHWIVGGTAASAMAIVVEGGQRGGALSASNNSPLFSYGGSGVDNITGTSVWQTFGYAVDAAGNFTFMVDGQITRTGNSALPAGYTARPIRVGADNTNPGFSGQFAHVAYYSQAMTAAQLLAEDAALRQKYSLPAAMRDVLPIPSAATTANVTHPDVIDTVTGWNGYRYWMGMTPFPRDADENPHILASNDGSTWVAPPGLTNPVVTLAQAQAAGYAYNSDTDMLLLPNGIMECYFRYANPGEAVLRITSTDGITWTPPRVVLSSPAIADILSPAMALAADGSRLMWTINRTTGKMQRRTSPDGITWSTPTDCTITGLDAVSLWHLDVNFYGGAYHCLMSTYRPYRLRYLTSPDGLAWTGDTKDAVPISGTSWDAGGHYRSAMVPLGNGYWDVFVAMMSYNQTGGEGEWKVRRVTTRLPRLV